ncbi:hypothetical protein M569_07436, partial [Genlisea aurea]
MSRLWARFVGLLSNRTLMGVDKAGNRYFARTEEIDGLVKEKRWVVFKGEQDPTSVPVEWISWLNGQRKRAPTTEEMAEMEERRRRVQFNVALLKKEEEGRKATKANPNEAKYYFIKGRNPDEEERAEESKKHVERLASEPSGSGESFRPGSWQPPT